MNDNTSEMMDAISYIYSKYPSGTHKIMPVPENQEDLNDGMNIFIFEMLLEFYLEGLCHASKLYKILNKIYDEDYQRKIYNQKYDDIVLNDITIESLKIPELWINSIGFILRVVEDDYDSYIKNIKNIDYDYYFKNHYCKIITKYDIHDKPYFEYRNITKPYHCLINNEFYEVGKDIKDIFALLRINNKIYKIYFIPRDL